MTDGRLIIGYDAKRIVHNATGLGNYGRTLVNDLCRLGDDHVQLRLYAPDEGRADLRAQLSASDRVQLCTPATRLSALRKAWWRSRGMVESLVHDGVAVYHGLSGELPVGLKRAGIRGVLTVHDLIFMRHPEYYHWLDRQFYTWKFHHSLPEADRIIAISECTKRDIMEYGGVPADKIDVVYQSCAPRFGSALPDAQLQRVRRQYSLPRRFILNVGTVEERKNVLLAVRSLPSLPSDVALVVVGKPTAYADKVRKYVAAHGLSSRVFLLHGIGDDELAALYQLADVFVYPSRYEGFGIPIIEAIHSGLPVVACTGSCLEEAGGPDSLYVSPDDAEGMAAAVSRLLKGADGREQRIKKSQSYVRRFEGQDVAGQVMDIYRNVLG